MNDTHILVGTSGWVYADWDGQFYPKEVKGADCLSYCRDSRKFSRNGIALLDKPAGAPRSQPVITFENLYKCGHTYSPSLKGWGASPDIVDVPSQTTIGAPGDAPSDTTAHVA